MSALLGGGGAQESPVPTPLPTVLPFSRPALIFFSLANLVTLELRENLLKSLPA